MRIIVAVVLALPLLAACAPPTPEVQVVERIVGETMASTGVLRWCDSEASVVCWKWGYGIDCMPLKDTTLLECK